MVAHDISRLGARCFCGVQLPAGPTGSMVTGRFGAPRPASALAESRRRTRERSDLLRPTCGCSRISRLVSRVVGRTDALRTLVTPLSHGTDSWRGGMADQLSLHQ